MPEPQPQASVEPTPERSRSWIAKVLMVTLVAVSMLMMAAVGIITICGGLLAVGFGASLAWDGLQSVRESPRRTAAATATRLECTFAVPEVDTPTRAFSLVSRIGSFGTWDITKVRSRGHGADVAASTAHVFADEGVERRCPGGSTCPCLTVKSAVSRHVTTTSCENHAVIHYDPQDPSKCAAGVTNPEKDWTGLVVGVGVMGVGGLPAAYLLSALIRAVLPSARASKRRRKQSPPRGPFAS